MMSVAARVRGRMCSRPIPCIYIMLIKPRLNVLEGHRVYMSDLYSPITSLPDSVYLLIAEHCVFLTLAAAALLVMAQRGGAMPVIYTTYLFTQLSCYVIVVAAILANRVLGTSSPTYTRVVATLVQTAMNFNLSSTLVCLSTLVAVWVSLDSTDPQDSKIYLLLISSDINDTDGNMVILKLVLIAAGCILLLLTFIFFAISTSILSIIATDKIPFDVTIWQITTCVAAFGFFVQDATFHSMAKICSSVACPVGNDIEPTAKHANLARYRTGVLVVLAFVVSNGFEFVPERWAMFPRRLVPVIVYWVATTKLLRRILPFIGYWVATTNKNTHDIFDTTRLVIGCVLTVVAGTLLIQDFRSSKSHSDNRVAPTKGPVLAIESGRSAFLIGTSQNRRRAKIKRT